MISPSVAAIAAKNFCALGQHHLAQPLTLRSQSFQQMEPQMMKMFAPLWKPWDVRLSNLQPGLANSR